MIRRIKRLKNGQVQLLLTPRAEKAGKRCPSCGRWLPLNHYHLNRANRDGHQYTCKICVSTEQRRYYQGKGKETRRRYAQTPKMKAYQRSREAKAAHKRYRKGPKYRARRRAWDKAKRSNLRAERLGVVGRLTACHVYELELAYTECIYCLGRLPLQHGIPHSRHLDHIMAMTIGGANSLDNVVVCCPRCNSVKGNEPLTVELLSFLRNKPCTEADVQAIYDNAARLAEQIKRNGKPTSSSDRKDSP